MTSLFRSNGPRIAACALALLLAPMRSAHAQAPGSHALRELAREVAMEFCGRASLAEHDGRGLDAEALYYRALTADPGYLAGYLGYARTQASRGHTDDALRTLAAVPPRAVETDHDAVQLSRVRAQLGDVEGALESLGLRSTSVEAAQAAAEVASQAGRFPQALLAARRFADLAHDPTDAHVAARLARALALLVGDGDCVRVPGAGASLLRRLLAR